MNDTSSRLDPKQGGENSVDKEAIHSFVMPSQSQPKELLKLALLQTIGTLFFSVVLYYCFDAREALSALFGGLIAVVGSLYSAGRLFTTKQDVAAQEMLLRFYVSVVLKITFTLLMMGICIIVIKVSMLPFIIGFLIAAVFANLLVLLLPSTEAELPKKT